MKDKIIITIEVNKIDKNKIVSRTYQNSQGETVTVKELKLEIIPLNETKFIKEGDNYRLFKTHFVAEQLTAEERTNKVKSKILGSGVMFKSKEVKIEQEPPIEYPEEQIGPEDIPF